MICITGSVTEEIGGIKGKLKLRNKIALDHGKVFQGRFNGADILLLQTGIGRKNAKEAVDSVVRKFPVKMFLSTGFAGGVNKKLSTADILLCNPVVGYNQIQKRIDYYPDTDLFDRAVELLKRDNISFHKGAVITVDRIISTKESRQTIESDYNALAVEMENSAIAGAARRENIPFLMVRAISDTVHDDISFLDKCQGNFFKLKLSAYALSHPEIIPGINKLRKDSRRAAKSLTSFVYNFLMEIL